MVKNLPANVGDTSSMPGSGRSPGKGTATAKSLQSCLTLCDPIPGILQARTLEWATHFSILAWETPWAEKLGGLQSTGS